MRDDFMFDGRYASEYGLMMCDFSSSSDDSMIVSDFTYDTFIPGNSDRNYFTASSFSDVLITKIQVCIVDKCQIRSITDYDIEEIAKWLCRENGYHRFAFINKDRSNDVEYNAKISINKIKLINDIYGLELTITTDSQYGFTKIRNSYSLVSKQEILIKNHSAKSGGIFPEIQLTCKESGNYQLSFRFGQHYDMLKIQNCSVGEVITISNMHVISSSIFEHDIYNDFNYVFPMIRSDFYDNRNYIQTNLSCDFIMVYESRRKVGI